MFEVERGGEVKRDRDGEEWDHESGGICSVNAMAVQGLIRGRKVKKRLECACLSRLGTQLSRHTESGHC